MMNVWHILSVILIAASVLLLCKMWYTKGYHDGRDDVISILEERFANSEKINDTE